MVERDDIMLAIGNINIDDYVNNLQVTIKSRNINKSSNLQGDLLMDRTKLKHFISFNINLVDENEWKEMVKELEKSSFNFSFKSAKEGQITREFVCEEIPSPRFVTINNVDYYKDISLSFEEI